MSQQKQIISEDGEFELWEIDRLIPYENNVKKHPPAQVKKIAASMRKHGFRRSKAIEVTPDGLIINGHGRRLASIEAGLDLVWVSIVKNMSENEIRAYRLADNEVARSDFDGDLMAAELQELHFDADYDMSDIFEKRDLEFLDTDLGEMDLNALTQDLAAEVENNKSQTEDRLESEKDEAFPLSSVFPFKTINAQQKRSLTLLLALAEGETSLQGIDALVEYSDLLMRQQDDLK